MISFLQLAGDGHRWTQSGPLLSDLIKDVNIRVLERVFGLYASGSVTVTWSEDLWL